MEKAFFYLCLLIVTFSSCAPSENHVSSDPVNIPSPSPAQRASEIIVPDPPKTRPVFYETIDRWSEQKKELRLRDKPLSDNDIELRVWAGFGIIPSRAFFLKRVNGNWSAHQGFTAASIDADDGMILSEPARGWDAAWQSLLDHQLLNLPDAKRINCNANFNDGYSYVVELRQGRNYRTYSYDNPWGKFKNRCKEADEILAIASIITDDYRVPNFRVDD